MYVYALYVYNYTYTHTYVYVAERVLRLEFVLERARATTLSCFGAASKRFFPTGLTPTACSDRLFGIRRARTAAWPKRALDRTPVKYCLESTFNQRGSQGMGVVSNNWLVCVLLSMIYMFKPSR